MIPRIETLESKARQWKAENNPRLSFEVLDGLEQYASSRFEWLSDKCVECRLSVKKQKSDSNWFDFAWQMDHACSVDEPDRPWLRVFRAIHSSGPENWGLVSHVFTAISHRLRPESEIDRLLTAYLDFMAENIFEDFQYRDDQGALLSVYGKDQRITSDAQSRIENALHRIALGLKSIASNQAKAICIQHALDFFRSLDYDHFLTEQLFVPEDSHVLGQFEHEIQSLRDSIKEREEKNQRLERQVEDYMRLLLEDEQRYIKDAVAEIDSFETGWQKKIRSLYQRELGCATEKEMFLDLFSMIDPQYHKIEQRRQVDGSFGTGKLFFGDLRWFIEKHWEKHFQAHFLPETRLRTIKAIICELNEYRNILAHPQDSMTTKKDAAIKALAVLAKYKELLQDNPIGDPNESRV